MAYKPRGRPAGRPEKPIDWTQFEQLCALQCTQSEIASMLKVNRETLSIRVKANYQEDYPTIYKRFAESGKCSLRRNQFVLSKKNASLAIWLGKIWLEQKDPGLEDSKQDLIGALNAAVREIQKEPRVDASSRSTMEDKQPVLDQGLGGYTPQIRLKLGSEKAVGGDACV